MTPGDTDEQQELSGWRFGDFFDFNLLQGWTFHNEKLETTYQRESLTVCHRRQMWLGCFLLVPHAIRTIKLFDVHGPTSVDFSVSMVLASLAVAAVVVQAVFRLRKGKALTKESLWWRRLHGMIIPLFYVLYTTVFINETFRERVIDIYDFGKEGTMPFAQQVGLFVLTHMISLCSASCVDFVLLYLVTCVSFFAVTTLCGGVVPRYLGLVVVGYISSLCWSAINEERKQRVLILQKWLQKEAAKAKHLLMATMHHELKNGLHVMTLELEEIEEIILEHQREQRTARQKTQTQTDTYDASLLKSISLVKAECEDLYANVIDILENDRKEAGESSAARQEVFCPRKPIQQLAKRYKILAARNGNLLNVTFGADLPKLIVGDRYRYTQICRNYMNNAIKFCKQGTIQVSVETSPKRHTLASLEDTSSVNLATLMASPELVQKAMGLAATPLSLSTLTDWQASGLAFQQMEIVLRVTDSGIGIDADKLQTIFTPWRTAGGVVETSYSSTGLGLSYVSDLARNFFTGGRAWAESPGQNRGSSFFFAATFTTIVPVSSLRPAHHKSSPPTPAANTPALHKAHSFMDCQEDGNEPTETPAGHSSSKDIERAPPRDESKNLSFHCDDEVTAEADFPRRCSLSRDITGASESAPSPILPRRKTSPLEGEEFDESARQIRWTPKNQLDVQRLFSSTEADTGQKGEKETQQDGTEGGEDHQKEERVWTLLLVDDIEFIRATQGMFFMRRGYKTILEADTGRAALSVYIDYLKTHRHFLDAVVTDLDMPQMNGAELGKHLHDVHHLYREEALRLGYGIQNPTFRMLQPANLPHPTSSHASVPLLATIPQYLVDSLVRHLQSVLDAIEQPPAEADTSGENEDFELVLTGSTKQSATHGGNEELSVMSSFSQLARGLSPQMVKELMNEVNIRGGSRRSSLKGDEITAPTDGTTPNRRISLAGVPHPPASDNQGVVVKGLLPCPPPIVLVTGANPQFLKRLEKTVFTAVVEKGKMKRLKELF